MEKEGVEEREKKRKGKTRTARINIHMWKRFIYIFRNNYNIRNISKVKLEKSQKKVKKSLKEGIFKQGKQKWKLHNTTKG